MITSSARRAGAAQLLPVGRRIRGLVGGIPPSATLSCKHFRRFGGEALTTAGELVEGSINAVRAEVAQ